MTIATYETRCAELGIDRGALGNGFGYESEERATVQRRESGADYEVRKRITPPPITEDLSHLVCVDRHGLSREEMLKRCNPERRALYASIYDRGETVPGIAAKLGLQPWNVHRVLGGRGSKRLRGMIAGVLTVGERGMM